MNLLRSAACAVALALLVGCGTGVDAGACREAATAQVEAEQAWSASLEAHAAAHEAHEEHESIEDHTNSSRVDLVVATEATRRACGG